MAADTAQTQYHTTASACSREVTVQLTALPRVLLEMIIIQKTSSEDKKALRLTCKLFADILDGNLTSTYLSLFDENHHDVKQFFKRMHNVPRFKAMCLDCCSDVNSLIPSFPRQLTTLRICTDQVHLQLLAELPCLTALSLQSAQGHMQDLSGLKYVSGLTRFSSSHPCGSLATLAPALKHLSLSHRGFGVTDTEQLTNLEILEMLDMPTDFFRTHGQLPLRHIGLAEEDGFGNIHLHKGQAWDAAPTTLNRLTLHGPWTISLHKGTIAGILPTSITWLQLYNMQGNSIYQASRALPGLINLDICLNRWEIEDVTCLSRFSKLQSLRLHIIGNPWQRKKVLVALPHVAAAVAKGVNLEVMPDVSHILGFGNKIKSVWATHV